MVELAYTLALETRYCKFESYLAHQYVSVAQLVEQLVEAQRVICSGQIWYTNLSGHDVNGSIGGLGTSCVGSNPAVQTIYI